MNGKHTRANDFPWVEEVRAEPLDFTADWIRYSPRNRYVLMGRGARVVHIDLQQITWRLLPEQVVGEHVECGVPMDDGGYWLLLPGELLRYSHGDQVQRIFHLKGGRDTLWAGTNAEGEWFATSTWFRGRDEYLTFLQVDKSRLQRFPRILYLCDVWWADGHIHGLSLQRRTLVHWIIKNGKVVPVARLSVADVSQFELAFFSVTNLMKLSQCWFCGGDRRIVRFNNWGVVIGADGVIEDFPWLTATPRAMPMGDKEHADRTFAILSVLNGLRRSWQPTLGFPYLLEVTEDTVVTTCGVYPVGTDHLGHIERFLERVRDETFDHPATMMGVLEAPLPEEVCVDQPFRALLCRQIEGLDDRSLAVIDQRLTHQPRLVERIERDLVEILVSEPTLARLEYGRAVLCLADRSQRFSDVLDTVLHGIGCAGLSVTARALREAAPEEIRRRMKRHMEHAPSRDDMDRTLLEEPELVCWALKHFRRMAYRVDWIAQVLRTYGRHDEVITSLADRLAAAPALRRHACLRDALGQAFDELIEDRSAREAQFAPWLDREKTDWFLDANSRLLIRLREVLRLEQGLEHQAAHALRLCWHYRDAPQALIVARHLVAKQCETQPLDARLLLCLRTKLPTSAQDWVELNKVEESLLQRAGVERGTPSVEGLEKVWQTYGAGEGRLSWYLAVALLIQWPVVATGGDLPGHTANLSQGANLLQRARPKVTDRSLRDRLVALVKQGPANRRHGRIVSRLMDLASVVPVREED